MRNENLIIMLCFGVCLAFSFYKLFLFWQSRDPAYLHYALTILTLAAGWSYLFGFWLRFGIPAISELLMPAFALGSAFSVFFARHFLQDENLSPRILSLLKTSPWAILVLTPITILVPAMGITISSICTSISLLAMVIACLDANNRGFTPSRYLLIASLAISLPFFIGVAVALDLPISAPSNRHFLMFTSTTLGALLMALAMANKLNLRQSQNKEIASELEQKVYFRTEALAEANAALEHLISELQKANSAKSHFLANMSHEIRTPLTSIIGYADSVLLGDIDAKEQNRVMRIISESGNHLLHIINDILDISKIEADKLEFELLPTSVFDVVAQVESIMAMRAKDKGLQFNLNFEFPFPSEITTDPTRFRQILFNLTNNAIKFTESGTVDVRLSFQQHRVYVSVADTGIGMDEEKVQSVFNPFEQGESSTTRKFGGTGLGLSISKRLANGLGGDIQVQSELDKGSTFNVNINAPTTENSVMVQSASEIWKVSNKKAQDPLDIPNFAGNRVLLVDDHPNNRELISILLRRMNIEVDEAQDGEQALAKVFSQEYDLVLMDVQMPIMGGDEATGRIREYGYDLPIIALTANNMKHEIELYMQRGFTNHLAKPIVRENFIQTLVTYLQASGSSDALIDNEEMYPLVAAYYDDLLLDLARFEESWQQQDEVAYTDIAHRIKGAAGSFGFESVGESFAEVEACVKQGNTADLAQAAAKAIADGKRCTKLPGIDVARGATNHDVNIDNLITALSSFMLSVTNQLHQLRQSLSDGDHNIALLLLNRIQGKTKGLAWESLAKVLAQMQNQLKLDPSNGPLLGQLLAQAEQQIQLVQAHLQQQSG